MLVHLRGVFCGLHARVAPRPLLWTSRSCSSSASPVDIALFQLLGLFSGLCAYAARQRVSGPRACAAPWLDFLDCKLVRSLAFFSACRTCAAPWCVQWIPRSCCSSTPSVNFAPVQLLGMFSGRCACANSSACQRTSSLCISSAYSMVFVLVELLGMLNGLHACAALQHAQWTSCLCSSLARSRS